MIPRRRILFIAVPVFALAAWFAHAGLTTVAPTRAPAGKSKPRTEPVVSSVGAFGASRITFTTPNTVRVYGDNVYAGAAAISQLAYAASQHDNCPPAVALARADREADAMLAAARISPSPVNAPVLYVDGDRLPPETLNELRRLRPNGNTYDGGVQVYLVGPIAPKIEEEIHAQLGFKTRSFYFENPVLLAEVLDRWCASMQADHTDEVVIVQYSDLDSGLPGVAWDAHAGNALLFAAGEVLPLPTKRALSRRYQHEAFIYILGDSSVVSNAVARDLADYGHVQRIAGHTPQEISVRFATFRDHGLNNGYWIGLSSRDFGWGVTEPGHNFTLATPDDWQLAVAGSLLSHLGKHGPLLLLTNGKLDEGTKTFLQRVKPSPGAVNEQIGNHAWILGDTTSIAWETQGDVDILLDPELKLETAAAGEER